MGMRFWKELEPTSETVKLGLTRVHKIDKKLKTIEDITEYTQEVASQPMFAGELQWDIHICTEYSDDQIAIIGRVHHGLNDGMGTMMMLASIDGNKNLPAIPQMKDISFFTKFCLVSLSPFFAAYSLFLDSKVETDDGPYVLRKGFSGRKKLVASKLYDFQQLR